MAMFSPCVAFIVKTTCSAAGTEKSSAAALRQRNSVSSARRALSYPPRPGELIVRIACCTARGTAAGFWNVVAALSR